MQQICYFFVSPNEILSVKSTGVGGGFKSFSPTLFDITGKTCKMQQTMGPLILGHSLEVQD